MSLIFMASLTALLKGLPLSLSGYGLIMIWLSFYGFWYYRKSVGWLFLGLGFFMVLYGIIGTLYPDWPGPIYIRFF